MHYNVHISIMKTPQNKQVAKILYEIADILEMNDVAFKPRAYRRAAREIEEFPENVASLTPKELEEIPGVGTSITEKVHEIGETGTCEYYEQLKNTIPVDITNLNSIEGIGPKTIKTLYEKLNIRNVLELEKAAKKQKIQSLEGFSSKSEENILKGIASWRKHKERFRLDEALHYAEIAEQRLKEHPATEKIAIAGSLRRKKETIGDMDLLISSKDPKASVDFFTNQEEIYRVLGKGKSKATVEFENGFQGDLRIIDKSSWGAALQYFTGDKAHNIKLRTIAIKKRLKLNEYGLFDKKGNNIASKTEEDIYKQLDMKTPPAEIRRDCGEIAAAQSGTLPNLVEIKDIKGDLQMHTTKSDGVNTAEEMASVAKKLGYEYIAVTDHNTEGLEVAGGIANNEIPQYIDQLKQIKSSIPILASLEINIGKEGELTVPDKYLKELDYVLIAIHSHFRLSKDDMTKRILKAFDNPYVHTFAHPTGRLLMRRDPYEFDFEAVCKKARTKGICLEINAHPERLDLDGEYAQQAKNYGCKFAIGTDSHSTTQLSNMRFGLYMARRGWLTKEDIINTYSYKKLKEFLER